MASHTDVSLPSSLSEIINILKPYLDQGDPGGSQANGSPRQLPP